MTQALVSRGICRASIILVMATTTTSLDAQSEASFVFYHGSTRTSHIAVDHEGKANPNRQSRYELAVNAGGEVCVTVVNAHPVNYRYSLDAVVDTTAPKFPDVSVLTAFLGGLSDFVDTPDGKMRASLQRTSREGPRPTLALIPLNDPDAPFERMLVILRELRDDVNAARTAADKSDAAEAFSDRESTTQGFRGAVQAITALPDTTYRFNDPKLKEHLDEAVRELRKWAGTDKNRTVVADGLAASASLLLGARDRLRTDYSDAAISMPRVCKTVARGTNTLTMSVARLVATGKRDTLTRNDKPVAAQLIVDSRFERAFATLDPLTLVAFARSVPEFAIRNDTLKIDRVGNPTNARPGIMLNLNPWSFGHADRWGLGFGTGIGFSAKDVISDLLLGLTLSYRDLVRVGAAWGRSSQPEDVEGATVDQRIPADFGKLDTAIKNGFLNSDAVYFLITVPGFAIGGK